MFNINKNRIKLNPQKFVANFELSKFLEQSIILLIGVFVFFNPFPHTTAIKEICYYTAVFFTIILFVSKKKSFDFKSPFILPFSLFIFWAFLSIFFAFDKENSIHDFYSHLVRYVLLYFVLINFFNSEKHLAYLSWVIIISSSIFMIGGLFYYYFILKAYPSRFGIFTQESVNIIGVITVFAFILALNQLRNDSLLYHRLFLAFSLLALFIGLLMTRTRSSLLAILLATVVIFYKNKKWMFVFLILMLVISAMSPIKNRLQLFNPRKMYITVRDNRRIKLDYLTLEVIKEHPIIGIGFGLQSFSKLDLERYQKKIPKEYRQKKKMVADPHNMLLDIAVRLGVIGLGFFFYIIFVFFKMCRNVINAKDNLLKNWGRCLAACFIGVCTIGLFQPIFSHMPEVVFCTIFSMTHIVWQRNNEIISSESKVPKSKQGLF